MKCRKPEMRVVPWTARQAWLPAASRAAIVLLGITIAQAIVYGPSLLGRKILLPLDILAEPSVYLPRTALAPAPHNIGLSDLVLYYEPERRFIQGELTAGRLPIWSPYRYAGAPCWRWGLSPLYLPQYLIASPVVLAWTELLIAMVGGSGAYCFFRRVLKVRFWPAAFTAWCYPLSGAIVLWQGYGLPAVMCWLPWVLLAADRTIRRPWGWGGPALAMFTAIVLLGGAADIAGQLLLASGLYAIWCWANEYGRLVWQRRSLAALAVTTLAWILGGLASTCLLLPMLEYVGTGVRSAARSHGTEERPPFGVKALPQVVLPDIYGSTQYGSFRTVRGNFLESSAGAYAGMLACLLAAPMAWRSRRHRSINVFLVLLGFVSLSWSLNVPGMVHLLRLPGLNMMSHNRLVFVTAFAILALAAVGLDVLWRDGARRRWWFVMPLAIMLGLGVWCVYRMAALPEPVASGLEQTLRHKGVYRNVRTLADVDRVRRTFVTTYAVGAALAGLGVATWIWLCMRMRTGRRLAPWLAVIMVAELLWFAHGRAPQCDPSLYYPPVPLLQRIAQLEPGRIIGFACLPANLSETQHLRDVRGYDGVDPAGMVDLLKATAVPGSPMVSYALTQWLMPVVNIKASGACQLSPILDMLNVRYVIFRGSPPQGLQVDLQAPDYWALVNRNALPRVFVPRRVETIGDASERLRRLANGAFDAREVAYVESGVELPASCRGSASIVAESPTQLTISTDMETNGLVVLADQWDCGWTAQLAGKPAPILRVNHAIRGIVAPQGRSTIVLRFAPSSLKRGITLSAVAVVAWTLWIGAVAWNRRISRFDQTPSSA